MSGPVGVVSVMRRLHDRANDSAEFTQADRDESHAARAAVAELIEAAKDCAENFRCVLAVNCNCDQEFIDRQTERLDAALVRVGVTP